MAGEDDQLRNGLCGTCENATGCTFVRSASTPVLSCEEFLGAPPRRRLEPAVEDAPAQPLSGRGDAEAELLGLCRFCSRRGSCQFIKPEGGVWHCEEYE